MKGAAHNSRIPTLWPEAIVVYMQGLPSPSPVDPKGKKNGWQLAAGRQGDRDLKFVDAVLKTMHEKHAIDDDRIYATGHSNGGRFTYVLWSVRPDIFAAYAPCAAILLVSKSLALKPGALLHIGGEKDRIAPFERQQESMAKVREVNGCDATAVDWAPGCKLYPPKTKEGTPFISFIYPGGHGVPRNSTELIIKFFKEHPRIHSVQTVR
jgi:polyhydroxybutyrate depolymerase